MATICRSVERRHGAWTVLEVAMFYGFAPASWFAWRANRRAPHKRTCAEIARSCNLREQRVLDARVRTQALMLSTGRRVRTVRG